MKSLFNKLGFALLLGLTLLLGLLRPCAAQRPALYDCSWAGHANARGEVGGYFGVSGADWTSWGTITGYAVTQDAAGLHVAVSADMIVFPWDGETLGAGVVASEVLHVTIAPDGTREEHVDVDADDFAFTTDDLPIIRGSAQFYWLP